MEKKTLTEAAPRRIAAATAASAVGRHWQEVAKGFSQSRDVSPILSPLFYPKLSFAHSSNRRLYFVEKKALLPDDKEWERNRCCLHHYYTTSFTATQYTLIWNWKFKSKIYLLRYVWIEKKDLFWLQITALMTRNEREIDVVFTTTTYITSFTAIQYTLIWNWKFKSFKFERKVVFFLVQNCSVGAVI